MSNNKTIVYVRGGVVQDVDIPAGGCPVEVRDYDIGDSDGEWIEKDGSGEPYSSQLYDAGLTAHDELVDVLVEAVSLSLEEIGCYALGSAEALRKKPIEAKLRAALAGLPAPAETVNEKLRAACQGLLDATDGLMDLYEDESRAVAYSADLDATAAARDAARAALALADGKVQK